jgi:glyoxylase-like metal-dependent hydrolase (beta-lactamase superfamily II)
MVFTGHGSKGCEPLRPIRLQIMGGFPMTSRFGLCLATLLLLASTAVRSADAQDAHALLAQAVAAEGGADTLRALKTLAIKSEAKHWEPEQSLEADGAPRFLGDSTITVTWDLAQGAIRSEWTRAMTYPRAATLKYTEIVTPALGIVTDDKGTRAMSGIRVATDLRELERASPTLLVKALDESKNVSAAEPQKLGNDTLPAISYADGTTKFIILFDKATHLPAAIRTRDDDNVHGDSTYDLVLGDWKSVAGVKLAHALSYRFNDVEVGKVTYTDVTPNPTIGADAFAVSDALKASAKAPAATAPYQWVIRRVFMGLFVDSDGVFVPPSGSLKLVELAPNVQQVVGGSHNNLIVALNDGIIVFDAPISEGQSRWVIDAINAKYPGRPIKYVVLTHHHMDHSGGTRAYVAEGATVVVPAPTKAHWDAMLNRPHTLMPDAEEKARKPVNVVEVKDTMTISDGATDIKLHVIDNPHVKGMIIGHVVQPNIVWVTDLWSPARDTAKNPGAAAFGEALKKLDISGATLAGGHGGNGKQSDLETVLAAQN